MRNSTVRIRRETCKKKKASANATPTPNTQRQNKCFEASGNREVALQTGTREVNQEEITCSLPSLQNSNSMQRLLVFELPELFGGKTQTPYMYI